MKLTVQKNENLDDDYVDIRYRELTSQISQILEICESTTSILLCEKDGAICRVDINDIFYVEWIDRKSFVYTKDDVFTLPNPLVEIENKLGEFHFERISKMTLVNLFKIKSVQNQINFKLVAQMTNGEHLIVTRHYRSALLTAIKELAEEVGE